MLCALSMAGAMVLAACGGGGGSDSGTGNVRMLNLTRTHTSLDLLVASTKQISAVASNSASAYVGVGSGNNSLQVTDAGSQTALVTTAPTVAKDQSYSLLVYENNAALKTAWLAENDTAPNAGISNLRVFNVATDAGALDVYVIAAGASLTAGTTPYFVMSGTGTSQISAYLSFTPGSYRVVVTASGNQSDVRLNLPSVTLADTGLTTLVLAPSVGGGLVDGGLIAQRSTFSASPNTSARVRVVSGVPSAAVAVSAGSTVVEAGAVQNIGSYVTVPSGSATWTVTAGGNAASVAPINLVAGSDNTLLVTGTAAAATATLLTDDNHAPTVSTNAKMRLINGLSSGTEGLQLYVDLAQVATGVTPGTASTYRAVTGSTNMYIEVKAASGTSVWTLSNRSIPGGNVYTVFVLGNASAPATTMLRDR